MLKPQEIVYIRILVHYLSDDLSRTPNLFTRKKVLLKWWRCSMKLQDKNFKTNEGCFQCKYICWYWKASTEKLSQCFKSIISSRFSTKNFISLKVAGSICSSVRASFFSAGRPYFCARSFYILYTFGFVNICWTYLESTRRSVGWCKIQVCSGHGLSLSPSRTECTFHWCIHLGKFALLSSSRGV